MNEIINQRRREQLDFVVQDLRKMGDQTNKDLAHAIHDVARILQLVIKHLEEGDHQESCLSCGFKDVKCCPKCGFKEEMV